VGGADATPASTSVTVAQRPSTTRTNGQSFDFDGDGLGDLSVTPSGGCPVTFRLGTQNGSTYRIVGSKDYRNVVPADIAGGAFTTGFFCVAVDYLDPILVEASGNSIYKAWTAGNDASGVRIEFELLQAFVPPPVTSFTFTTYDLIANFEDTSSGSPTSWSWTFGDGGTSVFQDPQYRYATAGTRSACLTPSNTGGSGSQVCQNVTVATVASTTVASGGSFQLDGDGIADLSVTPSGGACGLPNRLGTMNGTGWFGLAKDYRLVVASDASGVSYTTGFFCRNLDHFEPFLVRTTTQAIYRAWIAGNDGSGVRLVFAQLLAGTAPPVSDFTHTTFDLFAIFVDASTGGATSWSWNFGDGSGVSALQNPRYRYASGASRTACLVASNVGGVGNQDCATVTVAAVPSTVRNTGTFFDLDANGSSDLGVVSGPCADGPSALSLQGGSTFALLAKDYRALVAADAAVPFSSQATFCAGVDYLTPFLLKLGNGEVYRAWTAANDGNGIRLDSALLVTDRLFMSGFE